MTKIKDNIEDIIIHGEQPMKSKIICEQCNEDLSQHHHYLKCDKCGNFYCDGVANSSCWHNHLIDIHDIDWTVCYRPDIQAKFEELNQ